MESLLEIMNYTSLFLNDSSDFLDRNFSFWNSTRVALEFQESSPYYGEYLTIFRNCYGSIHGYLSFIVCMFGITANILNIIVLTRKNMVSPTNAILTGLAVADMLVMFSYLPFTFHNYIRNDLSEKEKFSYGWAVFTLFHAHFTVLSSQQRQPVLDAPCQGCHSSHVRCVYHLLYPSVHHFHSFGIPGSDGEVMYRVDFSEIAQRHDKLLEKINFWLFSVITKLVPCVALTALSLGLIRVLYETNLRRQRLKNRAETDRSHDRTTRMLLAVLLLFLLTEFPAGLLALLSGILGTDFFNNVYLNFGETMDALALINSAINFIIYCSMSRQFRDTFAYLFLPKCGKAQELTPVADPSRTVATTCV
ncbi:sex peptide receptor [Caerostris extrusa]|uniref:Sex peptide receptor n=1 Tax=Caerostris extrusa TaxID=172846 RepID=A0AAV4VMG6_CAEEX|nr:sex peptide receptor [Caerostris extrusa]